MAVPSTFADLSTTPASNSGLISDATAVNQIDNHLQSVYALIASIYANSGNGWASPYLATANPSYTGVLAGPLGSVTNPAYTFTGDTNTGLFSPAADTLAATTGGTERIRIDASGNVGIGVTPAGGGRLNINGHMTVLTGGRVGLLAETDTSTVAGVTVANYGGTYGSVFTGMGGGGVALGGYYGVLLHTAGAERMRIDASGNQINTPSNTPPTLTVNGQMNLTPTSNTNMRISYRGSDGVTRVANITLA